MNAGDTPSSVRIVFGGPVFLLEDVVSLWNFPSASDLKSFRVPSEA